MTATNMHEFSLCQNLLREAHRIARSEYTEQNPHTPATNDNLVITALSVRMGLFSGVDKHLMQRAFEVALHDFHCYWPTLKADKYRPYHNVFFAPRVELHIEEVPASVYCHDCDTKFNVDHHQFRKNYLSCAHNEAHKTQMLSGDELLLVNLAMHPQPGDPASILFGRPPVEGSPRV